MKYSIIVSAALAVTALSACDRQPVVAPVVTVPVPGPAGATGAAGPPGANGQTPTTMTCVESPTVPGTFDCTVTAWR